MKLRIVIWLVFLHVVAKSYSEDMKYHRYLTSSKDIPLHEYIMESRADHRVMYFVTDSLATDTIVMAVTIQYTPVDTIKGIYEDYYGIYMLESRK